MSSLPDDSGPFVLPDILLCSIIVLLTAILCSGAGIGGGSMNIATYVSILSFTPRQSVPLSKATILGAAIGSALITVTRKHPLADRPMIDYQLALLVLPYALVGSVTGVFFNVTMPEYIIMATLVIILSVAVYKTLSKALAIHGKERLHASLRKSVSATDRSQQRSGIQEDRYRIHLPGGGMLSETTPLTTATTPQQAEEQLTHDQLMSQAKRDSIIKSERHIPWLVVLALLVVWSCFVVTVILAGYQGTSVIGIECFSVWFWLCLVVLFIILTIATLLQAWRLCRLNTIKERVGYPFVDGDVHWNVKNSLLLPIACALAGSLGVGRGLIQGPIFLQLGLHPQVVTTTASFLILFNASAITLQYSLIGAVDWQFALWYGSVSFVGALIGQLALSALIRRTGKVSIAIFILATLEGISLCILLALGIRQMVDSEESLRLHPFCK